MNRVRPLGTMPPLKKWVESSTTTATVTPAGVVTKMSTLIPLRFLESRLVRISATPVVEAVVSGDAA